MYYTQSRVNDICITRDDLRGKYVLHVISFEGDTYNTRSRAEEIMYYTQSHRRVLCITLDIMRCRYVLHAIS